MSITKFSLLKRKAASQNLKLYKYSGYIWLKDSNNLKHRFNTLEAVNKKLNKVKFTDFSQPKKEYRPSNDHYVQDPDTHLYYNPDNYGGFPNHW